MLANDLADLEGEWEGVRVTVSDTDFVMAFPFLPDANACMKTIPGAVYDGMDKSWCVPITPENRTVLQEAVLSVRELFVKEKHNAEIRVQRQIEMAALVLEKLQREFGELPLVLDCEGGDITVRFPYHAKAVAIMRKIEGRRWDGNEKLWRLPADAERQIRVAFKALKKVLDRQAGR